MKTESKALKKSAVELKAVLDAEESKSVVKKVENYFVSHASIPGFRKGKVPLERIRREFSKEIADEVRNEVFRKKLPEAVKAENLEPLEVTSIKEYAQNDDGITFTATIDVKPVFKLPDYKGLKISKQDTSVSESELAERIEDLRKAYAKYEDAKEGECAGDGDFVQIDFTGKIDGTPIAEIAPEAKAVGNAQGFWVQIEEGRFLPEILDAIKGMKIGDSKSGVKVEFPKEMGHDLLKGKKAEYELTLKALRRRILPNDAELAERAKAESYEKLLETTRKQMEDFKIKQEAARREDELVNILLKKTDLEVPQSSIDKMRNIYLRQLSERAQQSGIGVEYFEKNRDAILKDADENAERQVKVWYIVEAIAKAENITADDPKDIGDKVTDFLLANAK